jgi:hypothetical protein
MELLRDVRQIVDDSSDLSPLVVLAVIGAMILAFLLV